MTRRRLIKPVRRRNGASRRNLGGDRVFDNLVAFFSTMLVLRPSLAFISTSTWLLGREKGAIVLPGVESFVHPIIGAQRNQATQRHARCIFMQTITEPAASDAAGAAAAAAQTTVAPAVFSSSPVRGIKTLAVDYGTKRVGLAVSMGIAPRPLSVVINGGDDDTLARDVLVHARAERVRDFVVGLPLDRDGSETVMSGLARVFAAHLATLAAARLPGRPVPRVVLWDERFTSAEAEARIARKGAGAAAMVDAIAACSILEHYFDENGAGAEVVGPVLLPPLPDHKDSSTATGDEKAAGDATGAVEAPEALARGVASAGASRAAGEAAAMAMATASAVAAGAAGAAAAAAVRRPSGDELSRRYDEARRAAMERAAERKRPSLAAQRRMKKKRPSSSA